MKKNITLFLITITIIPKINSMEFGANDGGEYIRYMAEPDNRIEIKDQSEQITRQSQNKINQSEIVTNFSEVRNLFPIFNEFVNDHPLHYFDTGATAQTPQSVIDSMVEYYEAYKSNVGRGLYNFAERSTQIFEATRKKIAEFINAEKNEIVFTSGATGGINMVAHIWGEEHIQPGDEIIVSEVEHNANFIPWHQLAKRNNATLKIIPLNSKGTLDIDLFKEALSSKTKLVAITHQSNILGTVNNIKEITELAHSFGAKVLIDAAQSIVHQKVDVKEIGCDFLSFSAHKLYGPTGVGALFIKQNLYTECMPNNFGGGMATFVSNEIVKLKKFPYCLETGTQPIAQVIGFNAAIDFVQKNINYEQLQEYETKLVRKLIDGIKNIKEIEIISPIPAEGEHNSLVTFTSDKFQAHYIASYLNQFGIAVRSGYHCCQLYHDKCINGEASVRITFSFYNTEDEVDFLIKNLKKLFN